MQTILKNFGMWLLSQEWFQFEVVKLVTKLVDLASTKSAESANTIDDKLVNIIKRNKDSILNIVKQEVNIDDTPIDDMLVEALEKL